MGMTVSNEDINATLEEMTDNRIPFRTSYGLLQPDRGFSERQFFAAMKEVLAAHPMRKMMQVAFAIFPPAQRWDYYCRLNRFAKVEVAAVPVAPFAEQVPVPDDATLENFSTSTRQAMPRRIRRPRFPRPHRIAVQYFETDMEKFANPKAITDAEIKEEYEKHKESFNGIESRLPEKAKDEKKSDHEKGGKTAKAEKDKGG